MENVIVLSDLKPMVQARIMKCLQKYISIHGSKCAPLGQHLQQYFNDGLLISKRVGNGNGDYNRIRFNRMNEREQIAYEKRLAARRYYYIQMPENKLITVPKLVFDNLHPSIVEVAH